MHSRWTSWGLAGGITLVLGLVVTPNALAAARYASPSGSGTECSQASPCNVKVAIEGAAANDEVFIPGNLGDYAVGEAIGSAASGIHIRGINGRPRLIASAAFGLSIGGASSTAEDLYVEAPGAQTVFSLSKAGDSANDVIVKSAGEGHACYFGGATTLTDSVCWAGTSGDLAVETDGSNTFRNDTLVGGTEAALKVFGRTGVAGSDTLVNVIARSGPAGHDLEAFAKEGQEAAIGVTYSNYATTASNGEAANDHINGAANDQSAMPLLVNAGAGDFHETAGSPTIATGENNPANGATDFDGQPREANGHTDIGADQFEAASGGGGGTGETPQSCNPLLGTCNPEVIACLAFWAEDCGNLITRPQPPQVCISAFEDCSGFGSGKTGKSHEIDLSGFPGQLKATVACDQKTGAVGGLGINSAVTECEIEGHLEVNNPDPQADKLITYTENLRIFQGGVDLEFSHLGDAVISTMYLEADPGTSMGVTSGQHAASVFRGAMKAALMKIFDQAKTPGHPVDTSATFDVHPFCGITYGWDPKFCERLQANVQKDLTFYLNRLQKEKHKWGLDEPEPSAAGSSSIHTSLASASAPRSRKKGKGPRTLVIAAGGLNVANGKTATLTMRVSRAAIKHLRLARKHGKRKLRASATIRAVVTPGIESTRMVPVRISLVRLKRHHHGKRRRH